MAMAKRQGQSMYTKITPILVIGFGSIGQRHYRNLLSLGYTNVAVHDTDHAKLKNMGVPIVHELTDGTLRKFPIVFICNPSHLHVPTALRAAKAGCHMFIEKPLALKTGHIKELDEVIRKNKLSVMVACNYRFHPAFDFLRKKIRSGKLGKPLLVNVAIGYDLRTARPGTPYQNTYAVSRVSGGGVIFDSGAHVIDYLLTLFGNVKSASAVSKNLILPIEAEDFASIQLEFKNDVFCTILLDYFSIPQRNFLEIQCVSGKICWDVVQNNVTWTNAKGVAGIKKYYEGKDKGYARNDMFIREVKYFMDVLNKKKITVSDVAHAEQVSILLSALLQSTKTQKNVKVLAHP